LKSSDLVRCSGSRAKPWLALPPESEYTCEQEILTFEEDLNVRYMMLCEKRGHEQGVAEGLEQGREQGLQRGRERGLEEAALNLQKAGASPELIFQATGLRLEDLKGPRTEPK
jgi:predicted transposase/invertase (TIGR01784 family)